VLLGWWNAKGAKTEQQVFAEVTPKLLPGCSSAACVATFRNFSLAAADVVLHGQWGGTSLTSCGDWMRDDRIGGLSRLDCLSHLGKDESKWALSLKEKTDAAALTVTNAALYEGQIRPHITDEKLAEVISVSADYAVHLYKIVAAGWPLLHYAYRREKKISPSLSAAKLKAQILAYDAAFAGYRAYGLSEVYAPSLYHPYELLLLLLVLLVLLVLLTLLTRTPLEGTTFASARRATAHSTRSPATTPARARRAAAPTALRCRGWRGVTARGSAQRWTA